MTFMHTVLFSTTTASAESVGGSTPGVRVTWNTTAPLECVTSVRVEFRNESYGPVVATYNTTNASETEIVQTDLQCATEYYITVVLIAEVYYWWYNGVPFTLQSGQVQVIVGGIKKLCTCGFNHSNLLASGNYVVLQIYQSRLV